MDGAMRVAKKIVKKDANEKKKKEEANTASSEPPAGAPSAGKWKGYTEALARAVLSNDRNEARRLALLFSR